MKLSKPQNDRAEVLATAIRKGYTDCLQFSWLEGYRTRISELRRENKVRFTPEIVSRKNRHGRIIHFKRHWLKTQADRDHAIGVFMEINKKRA